MKIETFLCLVLCSGSVIASKNDWVGWDQNNTDENVAAYCSMLDKYGTQDFVFEIEPDIMGCKISEFSGTLEEGGFLKKKESESNSQTGKKGEETQEQSPEELSLYPSSQSNATEGMLQENGIYRDPRTPVVEPWTWPYRVSGRLELVFGGDTYIGTGFLVGPSQVLTAGHNIFNCLKDENGQYQWMWASKISFYPEYSEMAPDLIGPFSPCKMYCKKGWVDQEKGYDASKGAPGYDMALLVLDRPIGLELGWGGLKALDDSHFKEINIKVNGYPVRRWKGEGESLDDGGNIDGATTLPNRAMLEHSGTVKSNKGDRISAPQTILTTQSDTTLKKIKNFRCDHLFSYDVSTSGGQSGSGCWLESIGGYDEKHYHAVGVHTRGLSSEQNAGVLLGKNDLIYINALKNQLRFHSDAMKKTHFKDYLECIFNISPEESLRETTNLVRKIKTEEYISQFIVTFVDNKIGLVINEDDEDKVNVNEEELKTLIAENSDKEDEIKRFLFYVSFMAEGNWIAGSGCIKNSIDAVTRILLSNIAKNQPNNLSDLFLYTFLGRNIIGKASTRSSISSNESNPRFFLKPIEENNINIKIKNVDLSERDIKRKFVELTGLSEESYPQTFFTQNLEKRLKEFFSKRGCRWGTKLSEKKGGVTINLIGHSIAEEISIHNSLKSKVNFILK